MIVLFCSPDFIALCYELWNSVATKFYGKLLREITVCVFDKMFIF